MDLEWHPTRKETVLSLLGIPIPLNESDVKVPIANRLIIILLSLVFLLTLFHAINWEQYTFIPWEAFRNHGITWLSNFFLHAGFIHLLGNLYFLRIFGNLVEKNQGTRRFLMILLFSTLIGNLFIYGFSPNRDISHIGASGGIFGVMIYALLTTHRQYYGIFFFVDWIKVSAMGLAGIYLLYQFVGVIYEIKGLGDTSYLCHLGGAISGVLFWWLFKKSTELPMMPTQ